LVNLNLAEIAADLRIPLGRHPSVFVQVDWIIVHGRAFDPDPGRSLGGGLPAEEGTAAALTLAVFGFFASRFPRL
jgi:hypothetical protein